MLLAVPGFIVYLFFVPKLYRFMCYHKLLFFFLWRMIGRYMNSNLYADVSEECIAMAFWFIFLLENDILISSVDQNSCIFCVKGLSKPRVADSTMYCRRRLCDTVKQAYHYFNISSSVCSTALLGWPFISSPEVFLLGSSEVRSHRSMAALDMLPNGYAQLDMLYWINN